jgi:hypothetical protein
MIRNKKNDTYPFNKHIINNLIDFKGDSWWLEMHVFLINPVAMGLVFRNVFLINPVAMGLVFRNVFLINHLSFLDKVDFFNLGIFCMESEERDFRFFMKPRVK